MVARGQLGKRRGQTLRMAQTQSLHIRRWRRRTLDTRLGMGEYVVSAGIIATYRQHALVPVCGVARKGRRRKMWVVLLLGA